MYSARIDTLWMSAGSCGVAIGAAYWPLLLIHGVGSRLRVFNLSAYTERAAGCPVARWVCARPRGQGQLVGNRAIAANVSSVCDVKKANQLLTTKKTIFNLNF
jgi:hypothetical protein